MHERTHSEIGAASSAENIFGVPPHDPDEKRKKDDQPNVPPARYPSRSGSSKYDFVKVRSAELLLSCSFVIMIFSFDWFCCAIQVKVWLGENADHYYVLSRFLLSRMLTVTKVTCSTID